MKQQSKIRKFGRFKKQREALITHLAYSLIKNGNIITTISKAKSLRSFVEKLISKAKNKNLSSYRIIIARLQTEDASIPKKLYDEIAPRYQDRPGGYLRVVKIGKRKSDDAEMAQVEFV